MRAMRGWSHALCLNPYSPSGSTSPGPLAFHNSITAGISNGAKSVTDERIASTKELADKADEIKLGKEISDDLRIPRPPERAGRLAWVHELSENSTFVMELTEFLKIMSNSSSRSFS